MQQQFVSESAKGGKSLANKLATDSLAEALLPVRLSPEQENEIFSVYYPGRAVKKTKLTATKHYAQLIEHLGKISFGLNSMFSTLRYAINGATYYESLDRGEFLNRIKDQASGLLNSGSDRILNETVRNFMSSLAGEPSFIIRPSEKFKEGYDLVFSRVPRTDALNPGSGIRMAPTNINELKALKPTDAAYSHIKDSDYATDLAKTIKSNAHFLIDQLFPNQDAHKLENSHKRQIAQLPLDYKFKNLNGLFDSAISGKMNLEFVQDVPQELIRSLSKYVSILVIRDAPRTVLAAHVAEQQRAERQNTETYPVDNSLHITEEYNLLAPTITFSIVMHIPKEFAQFITQTPDGEQVPLIHLNTWALVWSRALLRAPGRSAVSRIPIKKVPRYILPPSRTKDISTKRKEMGYYSEEGRCNDDGIFVSNTGTLAYCPKSSELDISTSLSYEKDMNAVLEESFDFGVPVNMERLTLAADAIAISNGQWKQQSKIVEKKKNLLKYSGALLSYSWDYNHALYVGQHDVGAMVSNDLSGTTVPSSLAIADYLGFNFAEENETPIVKKFDEAMLLMVNVGGKLARTADSQNRYNNPKNFVGSQQIKTTMKLYRDLCIRGHVPTFDKLVEMARKELGLDQISSLRENPFENGVYFEALNDDFTSRSKYQETVPGSLVDMAVLDVLYAALEDAAGGRNSNLRKELMKEYDNDYDAVDSALEDHPRYFDCERGTMAKFGNVYNYLGGKIFQIALGQILATPKNLYLGVNVEERAKFPEHVLGMPIPFSQISSQVLPVVTMFAKYIPQAEEFFKQAEEEINKTKLNSDITPEDIHIPGSVPTLQNFPHQIKTQQVLRNRPKYGVLDISPGGGKTISLLEDATACSHEVSNIKPLILAPDGLVKNWAEDLVKVVGGNWNVIPLTTRVFQRWGEEKLRELLEKAPRNTIVVAGLNFIKSKIFPVVIGNHVTMVSGALEFVKRFGFNYIAIDESHKLKNFRSQVHGVVKQLTTASNVAFVRLATGTLISNKLTDVVGQAAMFSAHVFRTPEEYEAENGVEFRGSTVVRWAADTPQRARRKLAHHAAVITLKKKEWAFMLPSPVEQLFFVSLSDEKEQASELHQQVYNTVLESTLEELSKLKSKAKAVKAESDEDNDEEDDDSEQETSSIAVVSGDDDEDLDSQFEFNAEEGDEFEGLEGLLRPYLQRLEMILTDPLGDPLGREIFERAGVTNFVSRKVRKVIERIDAHFDIPEWEKGKAYKEYSLVRYKGKLYLAKKQDMTTFKAVDLPISVQDPASDTKYWREEAPGKILIFCRYTRSVNAIYNALPDKYKKVAKLFTSEQGKEKWDNVESFKKSDEVQILIANEQAITEGHNLQIGSRLIRVESPWAPGDLDQSQSRIFRPDPAGAKAGKLKREIIFLDWIISNNTMEVAKMGRLIHKMVNKTKFDELGNPRYDEVMDIDLPIIPMTLETIASTPSFDDIVEYTSAYQMLSHTQSQEFADMRAKQEARMIDIPVTPIFSDAVRLEHVPYLHDQSIADMNGYGLMTGREFLEDKHHEAYRKDPKQMVGMPVHTEFGNGTIVGLTIRAQTSEDGEKLLDRKGNILAIEGAQGVRRLTIQLKDGEIIKEDLQSVYIATTVNDSDFKKVFLAKGSKPSKIQDDEDEILEQKRIDKNARKRKKELETADIEETKAKVSAKRKSNKLRGKPVDDGVAEIQEGLKKKLKAKDSSRKLLKAKPEPEEELETPEEDRSISMYPVIYNGFLAVEADSGDPDSKLLSDYGFKHFGSYAFVKVKNYKQFVDVIDYLEAKFTMSRQTEKRLEHVQDAFEQAKTYTASRFNADLYDASQLPNFFRTRHKMVTDRKEIKVYPVVMGDALMLAVDIATNPAFKRHIGKAIVGPLKWKEATGMEIYFASSKQEIADTVKAIRRGGIIIENIDELKDQLKALKFRKARM